MPIRPPWFFMRRNSAPEICRLTCAKCGFDHQYELARNCTVLHDPEGDDPDTPEVVDALPKACPKCGARLKKEKIPIRIVY